MLYLYKGDIYKMTTKKTVTKSNSNTDATQKEKEKINKITKEAFEKGKLEGQQEVWNSMSSFIRNRMFEHYENQKDTLSQEMRDLLLAINKNIS